MADFFHIYGRYFRNVYQFSLFSFFFKWLKEFLFFGVCEISSVSRIVVFNKCTYSALAIFRNEFCNVSWMKVNLFSNLLRRHSGRLQKQRIQTLFNPLILILFPSFFNYSSIFICEFIHSSSPLFSIPQMNNFVKLLIAC